MTTHSSDLNGVIDAFLASYIVHDNSQAQDISFSLPPLYCTVNCDHFQDLCWRAVLVDHMLTYSQL